MSDSLDHLTTALASRYAIEREIGRGGMAIVYLAHDLKHQRKVAVKVLRRELAATLGAQRFLREIEIAANLTHPHILPLYDSGEADGFLYYVMPYIEGETLSDRINREGQLPLDDALQITKDVAAALSYAHSQGLIHRDIKPENVLLSAGEAVVADFGIARAVSAAGGERLTETGLAVGTPAYMSPEQAAGESEVDARSDLYSLGCVLYEMLAGDAPYTASTPQALIAKKLAEPTPRISVVRESVPPAVETALSRALAKTPADRFVTAQQFAEALTAEMVEVRVGRARWPLRAVAAASIGVVIVAAWFLSTILGGPAYERLAVLPPANLMNDPEQEYFVSGMHNALISELQKAGVAVIGRTSVLQYENTQKPIREIATELGVDALVEGSVYRAGDSVEIDPDYALAYEGIAIVWMNRQLMGIAPASEAAPKARAAVERAVSLDNAHQEVQYTLAVVRAWTDWDWTGAEAAFQRAIELNPNYPTPRAAYAHFLIWMRRQDEAMRHAERAIELDPLDPMARSLYGFVLYLARRYDDAIAQFQSVLERDPNYPAALNGLSNVYHAKGMYDEEVAAARLSYAVMEFTETEEALALFYAEGDYRGAARRMGDTLAALRNVRYVDPMGIAWWYLCAGQTNLALDWLERSFEERNSNMPYLNADPIYDPLREDPRFRALRRRMGLPE